MRDVCHSLKNNKVQLLTDETLCKVLENRWMCKHSRIPILTTCVRWKNDCWSRWECGEGGDDNIKPLPWVCSMADVLHHLVFLHGSIINNMYIPVMNDKEGNHEDQLEQIWHRRKGKEQGQVKVMEVYAILSWASWCFSVLESILLLFTSINPQNARTDIFYLIFF